MSLSEASKTHKKTRAFREDGAGAPASPGVAGVRASARSRPRCLCPVPPGGRDALTRPVRDRFPGRGVGWSWRSLACPRAARRRLLPTPPARALGEGATPERDAALWALYAVPQSPREGSPQARPAWPRPPSRAPVSSEARGSPPRVARDGAGEPAPPRLAGAPCAGPGAEVTVVHRSPCISFSGFVFREKKSFSCFQLFFLLFFFF